MSWSALSPTAEPTVRFCEKCSEAVYFCNSESEFKANAEKGRCVAIVLENDAGFRPPLLGIPAPPRPDEAQKARNEDFEKKCATVWKIFKMLFFAGCLLFLLKQYLF
jgi:hypothetical protein